jgi:broad-specificity NMP kinase
MSRAGIVDGSILWLTGATGVGKSTVGFTVYQKVLRAGQMLAYLDLEQINFHGPARGDDRARARSVAAIWRTYRTAGAQGLVMVGPVDDEATVRMYTDALSEARMTVCRLHAGPDQLTERIMQRGQGGSWAQPGDPLKGQSPANLLRAAQQALLEADALERSEIGTRIDTSTRTAEQSADAVLAQSGWPQQG